MSSISEQSGGFMALAALCFMIQPLVADMVREAVKTEPDCVTITGARYIGRDEHGVPKWRYPERRICYE